MIEPPLRLGLVGVGAISQAYTKALEGCGFARFAAMSDLRPEAVAAAAETIGCPAFTSHEEMADKVDLDAVVICTPPATHVDLVSFFVDRGIAVLCEKPFSTDVESARKTFQTADRKGVVVAMASKFRYVDDVIRARSIITSGVLGEIVLLENSFTSTVDMTRRWNSDPKVSGGGVLIDNGTHSVDIIRYLLGPIAEVLAVEGKRTQHVAVEDTVNMFVRTADGVTASVDLSWSVNKEQPTYIRIFGKGGLVRVGWQESDYRQTSSAKWVTFGQGYDKLSAFRRQMANFCNRVMGTEPLLISAEDAVASVAVIQAAYDSLEQGRWVKVPHTDPFSADIRAVS